MLGRQDLNPGPHRALRNASQQEAARSTRLLSCTKRECRSTSRSKVRLFAEVRNLSDLPQAHRAVVGNGRGVKFSREGLREYAGGALWVWPGERCSKTLPSACANRSMLPARRPPPQSTTPIPRSRAIDHLSVIFVPWPSVRWVTMSSETCFDSSVAVQPSSATIPKGARPLKARWVDRVGCGTGDSATRRFLGRAGHGGSDRVRQTHNALSSHHSGAFHVPHAHRPRRLGATSRANR